jgi:pyruvate formate lyase activating enzyme
LEILKKCKQNGISTAVDTAGHIPFENFEKILPYTDMFLYDFKIFDSEKHKEYVGVGNELILENLAKLLKKGVKVYVRIPVIENVNDSVEEMQKIKEFLYKNGKPEKVELLPYHAMGENKYRAIGKEPKIFKTPDKEKMQELRQIF